MKTRIACCLLALALLLVPTTSALAQPQAPNPGEEALLPEEEPRDQDLLVPTEEGPKKAKKSEVDLIGEIGAQPNEALLNSYLIGDFVTGTILSSHNIDSPLGIASITKLMTIYVALDAVSQGEIGLDEEVLIDREATSKAGSTYELKEGDRATVRQLITAGLVVSGNDAMLALAKAVAGSEEAFVERMNAKAKDLGLDQSHYINVHGLTKYEEDQDPEFNQMTAREIFVMTISLVKAHPLVTEISSMPMIKEEDRDFTGYNTNPLLGILPGITGLKTGYTGAAGRCLVATSLVPGQGRQEDTRLVGVFMGARNNWDRFVASKRMMEEAMDRYRVTRICETDQPLAWLEIKGGVPSRIQALPQHEGQVLIDSQALLEETIELEGQAPITRTLDPHEDWSPLDEVIELDLPIPLEEGGRVGHLTYKVQGEVIFETDLVASERVSEPNLIRNIQYGIRRAFEALDGFVA